ncbi:MAG: amidase [Bryobacterales bacterium]|nr:amidase [Bryobacterales bacterium]
MTRRAAISLLSLSGTPLTGAAASSLCFQSAKSLAGLMRRKKLSAREVLDAHLKQIERVNPKVNAIVTLVADQALAKAKLCDEAAARGRFLGRLHGLPVAHKDLLDTKGIRTTYGSPIFKDHVPSADTLIVHRIREAGAVTLGKTNTPEFGAGSQTFNTLFGATKNPHDLSKTCGGSSGGAAVALACGMIPIADGSDTGGSLRNPASFCGVVGFRSSPGRVPRVPTGSAWSTISVVGPMARSVADCAFFLSAMAGPDERAPMSIHEDGARFAKPLGRDFKGVRVAWFKDLGGIPFDRRIREVVDARRKAFESLGCIVEQAEPDFAGADEAFRVLRALSFHQQHAAKVAQYRAQIKATVLEEVDLGAKLTGSEITKADALRSALYQRVGEFFGKYEFFVLPVTQVPTFDIDQPYVTEIEGRKLGNYIDWMRSCYYISVLHNPAISVPGGFTAEGLPVGLQIVGRHHDDWGVLQMAHAFEQAAEVGRVPAVAV